MQKKKEKAGKCKDKLEFPELAKWKLKHVSIFSELKWQLRIEKLSVFYSDGDLTLTAHMIKIA